MGKCDIGFRQFLFGRWTVCFGRPPFKKKMENMRQLANLYPQYFQMAVEEGSGIKIRGRHERQGLWPATAKGLHGEQSIELVLEGLRVSYKDMAKVHHVGYSDAVALMKDGHAHDLHLW